MYDVHMEEGLVVSLQILLLIFVDAELGAGVTELVIFCGRRKCMDPNPKQ